MRIDRIPIHMRNTVVRLELPLYIDLEGDECRPPSELALGDTLMVLGLIRNHGRPVKLYFNPGRARDLVEAHPLIKEILEPSLKPYRFDLHALPVGRSGRSQTWLGSKYYIHNLPVLPVDQVRANPILGHSLHYKLSRTDDRSSVFVDPGRPRALKGLMPKGRPLIVVYPLNPGRVENFWQDRSWWMALLGNLRKTHGLIAVGAEDYGELAGVVDACLPMSDPSSTLPDLAWLLEQAEGFVGRDGGLSHLALAVNPRVVVIWDSMSSYRYWASSAANHVVMSNPYTMRYPQTTRMSIHDLKSEVRSVRVSEVGGGTRQVELPREGFEEKVKELFGSLENCLRAVLAQWEVDEERGSVDSWMTDENLRRTFYSQSLGVALAGIAGKLRPGMAWVAPVTP